MSALVVGVGNRMRRDDGAGPAVADGVRRSRPDLDVDEVTGDASRLLDLWAGRELVVLVDAVRSGGAPGELHRWELRDGSWLTAMPESLVSSHLVGVLDTVDLARALDRLPGRLVVVGVEVVDLGDGEGLSEVVAAAVDDAVAVVLDAVDRS